MQNNKGFTLAEILITLIIIGIVAVLSVPTLMRKYEDHVQVTAFKTAYSILSQAFKMAIYENGPIDTWELGETTIKDKIKPYLKVARDCSQSNKAPCINYGHDCNGTGHIYFKSLTGKCATANGPNTHNYHNAMVLENGMIIVHLTRLSTWYERIVVVDTNGKKGPNRLGYDVFQIPLDNKVGLAFAPSVYNNLFKARCNIVLGKDRAGIYDGINCYAWVLKHGNMDYKYRDVSNEW